METGLWKAEWKKQMGNKRELGFQMRPSEGNEDMVEQMNKSYFRCPLY